MSTSSSTSPTPVEDTIREKVTTALSPTRLEIHNDSHLHADHVAMRGVVSRETHFRLVVSSARFRGLAQPGRHRVLYALLADEIKAEGGIHALQLRTMTPEEDQARAAREAGGTEGGKEGGGAAVAGKDVGPRGDEAGEEGGEKKAVEGDGNTAQVEAEAQEGGRAEDAKT